MGKSREIARLPNAPASSASRTTSQALTSGQWSECQCASEDFGAASAYGHPQGATVRPA